MNCNKEDSIYKTKRNSVNKINNEISMTGLPLGYSNVFSI